MARRSQGPPPPERRSFDLEEAVRAKDRLTHRIAELNALDSIKQLDESVTPNYHSSARLALDNARATVRDIFGETSDEAEAFWTAQVQIDYNSQFPVLYRQRCVEEAVARLRSLIGIVDEKTLKRDTRAPSASAPSLSRRVFLVHGHDDAVKHEVARVLGQLELKPIILHEQPDQGRTIIEKFEAYTDVGFGVVLMTGDDKGGSKSAPPAEYHLRARQNVLLEMGFFLGKLGRGKVCVLYEAGVEVPSDYSGVLYKPLDKGGAWRFALAGEIKAAGISVDANRLL